MKNLLFITKLIINTLRIAELKEQMWGHHFGIHLLSLEERAFAACQSDWINKYSFFLLLFLHISEIILSWATVECWCRGCTVILQPCWSRLEDTKLTNKEISSHLLSKRKSFTHWRRSNEIQGLCEHVSEVERNEILSIKKTATQMNTKFLIKHLYRALLTHTLQLQHTNE